MLACCHVHRSAVCMKLGQLQDALADAEAAIATDPGFVKGFLRRAAAHESLAQVLAPVWGFVGVDSHAAAAGEIRHARAPSSHA